MYQNPTKAGKLTFAFNLVSALIIYSIIAVKFKGVFDDNKNWKIDYEIMFFLDIYEKPYTRVGGYVSGIYAGFLHSYYKKHDYTEGWFHAIMEWTVAIFLPFKVLIGDWPPNDQMGPN